MTEISGKFKYGEVTVYLTPCDGSQPYGKLRQSFGFPRPAPNGEVEQSVTVQLAGIPFASHMHIEVPELNVDQIARLKVDLRDLDTSASLGYRLTLRDER